VAMQDLVAVETARAFSATFYGQLMKHGLVDLACNEARAAILTRSLPGAAVPVLFMRLEMGVLLDMPGAVEPGRWSVPFWMVAALLTVVIGATAISVSLAGWFAPEPAPLATSTPAPPTATPTLTPLTGTFNVAVARFGEEEAVSEGGAVHPSEGGAVYSQWIYDALKAEFESAQGQLGEGVRVEVWLAPAGFEADGIEAGVIAGASQDERAEAAEWLAGELRADMVVYGHLEPEGASRKLDIELFIAPSFGEEILQVAGRYTLGEGATVAANPSGLDKITIARMLGSQAEALAGVTIGLILDLIGDHEKALELFKTLADDPDQAGQGAIGQLLYYFIGRQQLFLGNVDEAEAAIDEALAINPESARAQVVLGSVFLRRAGDQMLAGGGPAPELVDEALRHYQLAVDHAGGDGLAEASSRLSLASGYVLAGQSAYQADDLGEANDLLQRALTELAAAEGPLDEAGLHRYLAQAHQFEGNAYYLLADIGRMEQDPEKQRVSLEQAKAAYQRCIDQGELAPSDATLVEKIIGGVCRPYQDQVEQMLQGL